MRSAGMDLESPVGARAPFAAGRPRLAHNDRSFFGLLGPCLLLPALCLGFWPGRSAALRWIALAALVFFVTQTGMGRLRLLARPAFPLRSGSVRAIAGRLARSCGTSVRSRRDRGRGRRVRRHRPALARSFRISAAGRVSRRCCRWDGSTKWSVSKPVFPPCCARADRPARCDQSRLRCAPTNTSTPCSDPA